MVPRRLAHHFRTTGHLARSIIGDEEKDESPMRVAFLGPPGAGKTTHARELAREWSVPYVATGDMLREAVAADTPLGSEAKGYMDSGELVPDEAIIRLVADRLGRPDAARGFVLEGVPRTIASWRRWGSRWSTS